MAYDTPIGFTSNFNIALFGENSNPGSAQLNTNWQIIDEALVDVGIGPEDDLEINNLIINGSLWAREFIIEQVKASKGAIITSSANGELYSINTLVSPNRYVMKATIEDLTTSFAVGDIILIQTTGKDGTLIKKIFRTVSAVVDNSIELTTCSGTPPADVGSITIGDAFVQIGSETNSLRRGSIFITATNNQPQIVVRDGIALAEHWDDSTYIKAQYGYLGDLSFEGSPLSGYGLYGDTIFIGNKDNIKASQIYDDGIWGSLEDTEDALARLDEFVNDGKLTTMEKINALGIWRDIENEYPAMIDEANKYSVDTTNFTTAYNNLETYLLGASPNLDLDNPSLLYTTLDITRSTWDSYWDAYYYQRKVLYIAVTQAIDDELTLKSLVKTFIQADMPTEDLNEGDLWINTDDNNSIWRYNGTTWVSGTPNYDINTTTIIGDTVTTGYVNALNVTAQSVVTGWVYAGTINTSQLNADSISVGVQGLIDASNINNDEGWNALKTYYQTTAPSSNLNVGDIWYDTDDGKHQYRWNGTAWQSVKDADIQVAIDDSAEALALAGEKNTIFYGTSYTGITGMVTDDLFFDTDDNYKQYRYNGSAWVVATPDYALAVNNGTTTINGGKITTGSITANQISANTITASEILAGSITTDRLVTNWLSAETIDASQINAGTLTGFTIKTSTDNERVEITDADEIQFYSKNLHKFTIQPYYVYSAGEDYYYLRMTDESNSANFFEYQNISNSTRQINLTADTIYLAGQLSLSSMNFGGKTINEVQFTVDTDTTALVTSSGIKTYVDNAIAGVGGIGVDDITYENLVANGDVGTGSTQVAQGNHTHSGYEPAFSKNTGFNKNFGTTAGTVSEGNHTHSTLYEPKNTNIQTHIGITNGNPHGVDWGDIKSGALGTANDWSASQEFQDGIEVRFGNTNDASISWDNTNSALVLDTSNKIRLKDDAGYTYFEVGYGYAKFPNITSASQVVTTNASGNIQSEAKGTAFNKSFGSSSGTVAEGNHTHGYLEKYILYSDSTFAESSYNASASAREYTQSSTSQTLKVYVPYMHDSNISTIRVHCQLKTDSGDTCYLRAKVGSGSESSASHSGTTYTNKYVDISVTGLSDGDLTAIYVYLDVASTGDIGYMRNVIIQAIT